MKKLSIDIGQLPEIERIWGLSLPVKKIMYVCDRHDVFQIDISQTRRVTKLDCEPYRFLNSIQHFLGVNGHRPIHQCNGNRISYQFDPTANFVEVRVKTENNSDRLYFEILSGDWFAASFSSCGKYVVLAEPYDFNIYEIL